MIQSGISTLHIVLPARISTGEWLYFSGYMLVWATCMVIPFLIGRYIFRQLVEKTYSRIYYLFGAFIFFIGLTFLIDAIDVITPIDSIKVTFSILTGIIACLMIYNLVKFLPIASNKKISAQRKKHESRERFRLLVEEVKEYAIFILDVHGNIISWNNGAETIYGYSINEILHKHISIFYTKEDDEEPGRSLQQAKEAGKFRREIKHRRKDGDTFWVNILVTASHDHTGQFSGYSVVSRDVTERRTLQDNIKKLNNELEKKVEQKTKEFIASEKRFRALVEQSEDSISLLDENYRALYRSPSILLARIGVSAQDLSQTIMSRLHPEDVDMVKNVLAECLQQPGVAIRIMGRIISPTGEIIYAEGHVTNLLHNENVQAMVLNLRDITERKLIENDLRIILKELSDYKHAIDEAAIVSIIDANGLLTHVNDNFLARSQYSREELIGKKHAVMSADDETTAYMDSVFDILKNGEVWRGELKYKAKDGSLFWLDTTTVPFMDDHGVPYQYITIRSDVTERISNAHKLQELNNELEERVDKRTTALAEANKELEAFSYSVSHDLRAPLRIMDGYANILMEDQGPKLDDEGKRALEVIVNNAQKMGRLIDALLNLSRLGRKELQVKRVNMQSLVENVVREQLVAGDNRKAEIKTGELLPAMCDPDLVEHVWTNLISNAIKYSSKKEQPVIEINSEKEGGKIIYSVKDNGAGFNMKYSHKLFGVFQRLHKVTDYEGTGIGLALVQRIIKKNGGEVWAESEENKGATFYFTLDAVPN